MKTIQPKTNYFQFQTNLFDISKFIGTTLMLAVCEILLLTLLVFGGAR